MLKPHHQDKHWQNKHRNQIRNIVKACLLPHLCGYLSSSVTGFIKFTMGLRMRNSQSLPPLSSTEEIAAWVNSIDSHEEMVVQKLSSTDNNIENQPISTQTKHLSDKNVKLLAASQWNKATALLLITHWSALYQMQANNPPKTFTRILKV
ncbi:hypothetical protein VP01_891g4 [Puccinia sorghi]|uniref:Uncharacterized protein n=1 Tax=Puccinia sorghi TaxID=27349 RepID=A0A0L6UA76_9BASI|nr:hypothetical protein VP01_891g4 [Puccinia sorghi]